MSEPSTKAKAGIIIEKIDGTEITPEMDYYTLLNDPYLETREREELFVKQIVEAVEHSLKQSLPIFLSGLTAGMLERESPIRMPFPAPEKEQPDRDIDWDFLGE